MKVCPRDSKLTKAKFGLPAYLVGNPQRPISSAGSMGYNVVDHDRGTNQPHRARGFNQNVTLPAPSGPGFPTLPRELVQGFRKHSVDGGRPLVRYFNSSDVSALNQSSFFFVHTPSNRLRLAIYAVFECVTNTEVVIGAIIPKWRIIAYSSNPRTAARSALQQAYPLPVGSFAPLPDSFEVDTAATLLKVEVSSIGQTSVTGNFTIDTLESTAEIFLNVYATWEPNTPIADAELLELYNSCGLELPPTLQISI